jgi:hypothetical protein
LPPDAHALGEELIALPALFAAADDVREND